MSTTDDFRAMLTERGVEWDDIDAFDTSYRCADSGEFSKVIFSAREHRADGTLDIDVLAYDDMHLTPAQAIAATLGPGTCHIEHYDTDVLLGEDYYRCTACHSEIFYNLGYRFCPYCGAKVVADE